MTTERNREITGAGPWVFEPEAIEPGGTYRLDLRNMTYRGRKGYFKTKLPLDIALLTNDSDEGRVRLSLSNETEALVFPGTQKAIEDSPITYVEITNEGGTTIEEGDLALELKKSAYSADDEARDRQRETAPRRVIRRFTGI